MTGMSPPNHPPDAAWQVNVLADSARKLADQGELVEAERIYRALLQSAPYHVRALNFLAVRALERDELDESLRLLEQALRADPRRPILYQNVGLVHKARGELELALAALDRAIALRPDLRTALLHKGSVLEALGRTEEAITLYWQGWQQFPNAETLANDVTGPESLRHLFTHAAEMIRSAQMELITDALTPLRERQGSEFLGHVEACAETYVGLKQPAYANPLQRPSFLHLPGIPPRPFFERKEFPWIAELEAATAAIRTELGQVLSAGDGLAPYVQVEKGTDPQQWRELANSLKWSSFHLYKGGMRSDGNCARCPATLESVMKLPLPWIPGHAPEVLFSILIPGTHIPPHHGLGNYKLVVHLPLIVPDNCTLRVGNDTRGWREGECLIFDDSFQHEAWNRSDSVRAVLITEIWNPFVPDNERQGIVALVDAISTFRQRHVNPAN